MKNLKNLFSILGVSVLLIVAAQSCTKGAHDSNVVTSNDEYDQVDNSTISEEFFEMQEDPIPYEPEAVTVSITGGTLVADADADGKCGAWNNKATYLKSMKVSATPITLTLTFDKNVGITSIKNENSKTGTGDITGTNAVGQRITFSDVTMTDSTHWTVKIAASDTFRLGSAKMQIKYTELNSKMVPTAKTKNVTVYCMGSNTNGVFSSQKWGHAYEGGDISDLTATTTDISLDSANHWVPTVGDVIAFGSAKLVRGIITSTETPVAPVTNSQKAKGPKYKFRYTVWNTTCKGSRKNGSATVYGRTANTVKAWTGSTDYITGYVR